MTTIAILGGAGAMGAVFGARLARAGHDVTLIDVNIAAVNAINTHGVRVTEKSGEVWSHAVRAGSDPAKVGVQDFVLVFTKCYHTEGAIRSAMPMIGSSTCVVSLQNGWGNAPRIAALVGMHHVMAGVTYNSATLLGPGHTQHGGVGVTHVGELDGGKTSRLEHFAGVIASAGLEVKPSNNIVLEIWRKLALNACTLPTASLLQWEARKLIEHEPMKHEMAAILREVVAVANATGIPLDYDERWSAITGLLERIAPTAKGSMVIDIAARRRTEIDVINGAITAAGRAAGIPTPHNDAMLWMIQSMEGNF